MIISIFDFSIFDFFKNGMDGRYTDLSHFLKSNIQQSKNVSKKKTPSRIACLFVVVVVVLMKNVGNRKQVFDFIFSEFHSIK